MTNPTQPTDEAALLPCPFCGGTNLSMEDARDFISCRGCGTEGPFAMGYGSTASIEAWNRRTPADDARDAAQTAWPEPWRVGEYVSSSRPSERVLCLAVGEKQIAAHRAHKDFVRWVGGAGSTIAQEAPPC